jgi:VWFA-related protein
MRVLTVAVCVCLALGAQQERPAFRTTTRLVEFTVVALDKKGNPVTDLKQDELVVEENGRPRNVSFFRFEGAETVTHEPASLPGGAFSNRLEYSPGPARSISAIVLDTLNTEPSQMMWARAQVTRSLRALAPQTRVAVYHLGTTLGVIHDFTDDLDSLREKVARSTMSLPAHTTADIDAMARDAEQLLAIFPEDPVLEVLLRHQINQIEIEGLHNAAVRQRKLGMTLSALETLGQHLAGIPGRKNLVWIGGGISMLTVTGAMGFGPHGGSESREDGLTRSAQRLAQHGVALYVVDARGLRVPKDLDAAIGPSLPLRGARPFELQREAEEVSADPLPAAHLLASVTGGRVIQNTNDPIEGMTQAARDVRGSYSVGFYANEEPDGMWHRLSVRVKRPGVRLVYRQGFLAEQPAVEPVSWSPEQWLTAAVNPIASTAVALDATCQGATEEEPGMVVLTVQVDPTTLYFGNVGGKLTAEVEFGIAEKTADGKVRMHSEGGSFALNESDSGQQAQGGLFYTRKWIPAEGTRIIRIVVRDKLTGRHGTLDVPYDRVGGGQLPS